jgi:hypothetical protein
MVIVIPVFQALHNLTALGKYRKAVPGPGILGVFIMRCFLRVDLYSQKMGAGADRLGSCPERPKNIFLII